MQGHNAGTYTSGSALRICHVNLPQSLVVFTTLPLKKTYHVKAHINCTTLETQLVVKLQIHSVATYRAFEKRQHFKYNS